MKRNKLFIAGMSVLLAVSFSGCSKKSASSSQCNHVNHVSTQLPYALTTAAVSFVCYIVAGIIKNPVVPLLFGFIFMFAILFAIKNFQKKK